ncbi:MAG: DUF1015 domain-containing protein [Spirochaetaceae bacterium]
MADVTERLKRLGVLVPEILLPRDGVDLYRWAVIACDQHTSNRDYWQRVQQETAGEPSTLHLVLPEVYLEDEDLDERIAAIRRSMDRYLAESVLEPRGPLVVYTERYTRGDRPRRGLVVAVDLERYDYSPDSTSLIRATEETILSRLPVRERIRNGAPLEVPHIMLMLDDPDDTVFGTVAAMRHRLGVLYDTELMLGGGRVRGYALDEPSLLEGFTSALEALFGRYGAGEELLFAVGDGNHSLAAAKGVWERRKQQGADPATDPGRYALVEVVNLYDPALTIEPIHRVFFETDVESVFKAFRTLGGDSYREYPDRESGLRAVAGSGDEFCVLGPQGAATFTLSGDDTALPQERVEAEIERLRSEAGSGTTVDYIHGTEELLRLTGGANTVGIAMPGLERELLFPRVVTSGPLPRKMFSMGESFEKRYYLEARRID